MANKFQVSVADYVLRDSVTKQAIAHGMTLNTSGLNQTMQKTEVRGGFGNQLLYTFFHDRAVEFNLETPVFNSYILALQSGATVASGTYTVVETECVTLTSGCGTLSHTPTSDVTFIYNDNDASVLVTPSGSTIYLAAGADRMGYAIYDYSTTADRITVEGLTQPSVVELILTAKVYDASHSNVVQYFQVYVPQFKLDGNYALAMTTNDASKQSLKGNALLNKATDCTSGDYYYKATYINVDETAAPYTQISATPDPMTFTATGSAATQQITVLGYRPYPNTSSLITSSCTFTKTSGSAALTVSAGGLVTAGSAATAGMLGVVRVNYWDATSGSLTDGVTINVV